MLTAAGLLSPIDGLSEDLLSAHMAQHLLIADLAAPLLLVGLRSPVYAFFLPRPALVAVARRRKLRRIFRSMRRPLVAIPIYVLILYGWHMAFMFEGRPRERARARAPALVVRVRERARVVGAARAQARGRLHGELWKIGHLIGARLAGHVPRAWRS